MPKVIENLKERILRCAKAALLLHGYDALSIRSVAKECGIAVGTVYNYFPSKDMLAASVMLEDWLVALEKMRAGCAKAQSVEEALSTLYEQVKGFYDIYRSVWATFTFSSSVKSPFEKRHGLLIKQLTSCILPSLVRSGTEDAEDTALFLAENVLLCAGGSEMTFERLQRVVRRLLV